MVRRPAALAVLPMLLATMSPGRCCGPSVLRRSVSASAPPPWPAPLQSMRSWRAVALVRVQPRPRPLPVPTRGSGLKPAGKLGRGRWGESEAEELTVSPNRRATLSLKGMVMRASAAGVRRQVLVVWAGVRATRHDFHVVREGRGREKRLFSRGASLGMEEGPERRAEEGSRSRAWGEGSY